MAPFSAPSPGIELGFDSSVDLNGESGLWKFIRTMSHAEVQNFAVRALGGEPLLPVLLRRGDLHKLVLDRSSLTRWRQRMGEEKVKALLQESLSIAVKTESSRRRIRALPTIRNVCSVLSLGWAPAPISARLLSQRSHFGRSGSSRR